MPEVSIDSLTLKNFGPYYGEHTIDFTAVDEKCGILVGGRNGAGKTHLLRALYLAVVGKTGIGDLKNVETGNDATRFMFDRALNRKAAAEGQETTAFSITISQRDAKGAGARKATLVREIRHRQNSEAIWTSYAFKSESNERIDDESVMQKLRDSFLPRHLARFFFFDAERSQNFNLGQDDIVEGISRILGLWTYGELEGDLRQLIQQKIPKVFDSKAGASASTKLAEISGRIVTAEGTLQALRKDLCALELNERETHAELGEVEDKLSTMGAVDPEKLEQFQTRRGQISQAKGEMVTKVSESWEAAIPVALLGGFRGELHSYLQQEEKRREWDTSKSAVEPKIPQVKRDVFDGVPASYTLHPDFQKFYAERLEEALRKMFHPPPEGMSGSVFVTDRSDISAQIRARLLSAGANLSGLVEICTKLDKFESEARELDPQIRQLSQNTTALLEGGKLHTKRGELTSQLAQIESHRSELKGKIRDLEVSLAELRREETNLSEQAQKGERGQSIAVRAAVYREAVAEIKSRAATQLRKSISQQVGELWVEITERGREFKGIEFDNHWTCSLVRNDGKRTLWEDTNASAGQRQVRLLAFYEALRRLARLVPPLVVDTPLGRLDKEVKNAVLDRLYLSGHQSIILATDSEIDPDGPLFDHVKDRLARVYTLHPHGEEDSPDYEVRIGNDYFGRKL